jgi:hypothetical protein
MDFFFGKTNFLIFDFFFQKALFGVFELHLLRNARVFVLQVGGRKTRRVGAF